MKMILSNHSILVAGAAVTAAVLAAGCAAGPGGPTWRTPQTQSQQNSAITAAELFPLRQWTDQYQRDDGNDRLWTFDAHMQEHDDHWVLLHEGQQKVYL